MATSLGSLIGLEIRKHLLDPSDNDDLMVSVCNNDFPEFRNFNSFVFLFFLYFFFFSCILKYFFDIIFQVGLAIQKQRKILRIEKPCSSNFVDQLCDLSGQPIDGGVSKEVMGTADVSDVPDVPLSKSASKALFSSSPMATSLSLLSNSGWYITSKRV